MLIADMTSVNTGKKTKVVIQLQQMLKKNESPRPKYISCQHHVLNCILCLVMDNELHGSTKSPDIDYFFVKDLTSKYDYLKEAFRNGKAKIKEIGSWRDNMKFLYHLTCVFHHFIKKDKIPFVNFQQISNSSNVRWNSCAILALLAFIMMPETQIRLHKICIFISYPWADRWFSNQMFHDEDFDKLSAALDGYPKGLKCLKTTGKEMNHPSMLPEATSVQ